MIVLNDEFVLSLEFERRAAVIMAII